MALARGRATGPQLGSSGGGTANTTRRPYAVGAYVAEGHWVAGWGSWSCAHAGEDTMAAFGESCRRSGHVLMARFDPKRACAPAQGCKRPTPHVDALAGSFAKKKLAAGTLRDCAKKRTAAGFTPLASISRVRWDRSAPIGKGRDTAKV
jgi:hypothetical protein